MKLRQSSMKLSNKTVSILKNFSNINESILFKKGNTLSTISVMQNIFAEVEIEEDIPKDFGIYDLSQFLQTLDLYQSPELDFTKEDFLVVREGKSKTKYFFADANVIVTPPEEPIKVPEPDVTFNLTTDQLTKILKAATVMHLPDLSVIGEAGVVKMVARDKRNDTSNDYSIVVGETNHTFTFNYRVENLKILPGSYTVMISKKFISKFVSSNHKLSYLIALEPDSSFDD